MDVEIPQDAREMVGLAREFAAGELAPAELHLDSCPDPVAAFTSDVYQRFRKSARALGLHQMMLPAEIGGLALSPLVYYLVLEELAVGGAGLALVMQSDSLGVAMAARRRDAHQVYADYVEACRYDSEGVHSGAWAITEPDLGCDIYRADASFAVRARPTPGGSGFIINGAKSSWCANGWLADMLCVMINVVPGAGMDGTGVFLIPADWPGISKGRPISKVGLRALNQCDVRFDDVEVPKEFMIIAPGPRYSATLDRGFLGPGNTAVGFAALGIARNAARVGFDYAKTRHQGGQPIAQFQLVAKRLFDAHLCVQSAQMLLHRSAANLSRGVLDMADIYTARVAGCRAAQQVSADMLYLHGSNGITTEYPIEKLWRDAQPLQFADGTTDIVSLRAVTHLMDADQ